MVFGKYEKVKFPEARDVVASFPVRSIQVGVPDDTNIDAFEAFIEEMLAPAGITHLLLCLDYWFEFRRHPEIRDEPYTTWKTARRVGAVCRRNSIKVVPAINVLAHQSYFGGELKPKGMIKVYPDMEEKFEGTLHSSRCLCTRHPKLRPIVYDMIDELLEAFDTDVIHGGFDEVWDIGKCPRCKGVADYLLFAEYVNGVNAHIRSQNAALWMWGDQLIDGRLVPSTNAGYETCLSTVYKAADLLPRDIVICDWHYYDEPMGQLAPSYWAMKGFPYIGCVFNSMKGTDQMLYAMRAVRSERTLGTMLTTWCKLSAFIDMASRIKREYLETGVLHHDVTLEDSGLETAKYFASQASNMFMKMYVRRGD